MSSDSSYINQCTREKVSEDWMSLWQVMFHYKGTDWSSPGEVLYPHRMWYESCHTDTGLPEIEASLRLSDWLLIDLCPRMSPRYPWLLYFPRHHSWHFYLVWNLDLHLRLTSLCSKGWGAFVWRGFYMQHENFNCNWSRDVPRVNIIVRRTSLHV